MSNPLTSPASEREHLLGFSKEELIGELLRRNQKDTASEALVEQNGQLRDSEARLKDLFENAPDMLATTDGDTHRIIECNRAMTHMTGYTRAELLGQHVTTLYHPDSRGDVQRALHGLRTAGAEVKDAERLVQCKDGRLIDVSVSVSSLSPHTAVGQHQTLIVLRDITARKQAEAQLERTNAKLSQSNAHLEQFAYSASHDLKAPLRAIDSLSEWIEQDLGEAMGQETKENMGLLRGRVRRMEGFLDSLLTYSRAGRVAHDVATVDTSSLIQDIMEMEPRGGLTIKIQSGMPTFQTPRVPLEQVIRNLVSNAIKHHDRDDGAIEVFSRESGNFYEFAVSDDGPGIPPEFHDRVFQIFQTLKSRDEVEGSGMGLALVKKTVEAHGGNVTLESSGGRGTTFRFTWPKAYGGVDE